MGSEKRNRSVSIHWNSNCFAKAILNNFKKIYGVIAAGNKKMQIYYCCSRSEKVEKFMNTKQSTIAMTKKIKIIPGKFIWIQGKDV